jgi:hypothetical protein
MNPHRRFDPLQHPDLKAAQIPFDKEIDLLKLFEKTFPQPELFYCNPIHHSFAIEQRFIAVVDLFKQQQDIPDPAGLLPDSGDR